MSGKAGNRVVFGFGLAVAELIRAGYEAQARELVYAAHKPLRDFERSGLEHYDLEAIRRLYKSGIDLRSRPGSPHLTHLRALQSG